MTIDNYDFNGKRVLMRVDFNVPMDENYNVLDNTRIITALPTVRKILTDGGSIIFLTHLGRPVGEYDERLSLKHIVPYLSRILDKEIKFVDNCLGRRAKLAAENLQPGEILLLENLRFHKEEFEGDEQFAKELAELGDVYINNSFGTAHRAHASTYTIAKFFPDNRMLGYLVENEINNINRVLKRPKRPFTAILGGSQVSTKIHIILSLLQKVDNLIIAGGIAYTFVKAMGGDVGDSLVEEDYLDVAKDILDKAEELDVSLLLPIDCVIADDFNNNANIKHSDINKIEKGWRGMDIGIKSANKFAEVIESSSSLLWNGPIGVFEMSNFSSGTLRIALAVTRATDKGAFSLISGGDSIAALNKYNLAHKVSYVSTAGGALLEFIEGKQLPSLKAIEENI
ncbi:MAG: phosphoglycerate kinase [Bacteroidales bacterium]